MKSDIASGSRVGVENGKTSSPSNEETERQSASSFGEAVSFVSRYSKLLVLSDDRSGASIAIWPAKQGRVLTSSVSGPDGLSFGWINRELIASGDVREHINAVGGEDRIWVGPEGGQFSIFFAPGAPFDLDHWYTPAPIDLEPFDIVEKSAHSVSFKRAFQLKNYSGTSFEVAIGRTVRLLSGDQVWRHLGIRSVHGVKQVGYESENELTNLASASWNAENGLLSLWVLGQFQSTLQTTIILPIRKGPIEQLGVPVTTDYFGIVPADRISITEDRVLFKGDSNHRSKLGLSPSRAKGLLGSYDGQNHVLTIVQYSQPSGSARYVNSSWRIQEEPYKGDVVNCYNDGPPTPGKPQLGQFYELESSSPAVALGSSETIQHTQRTIHLVGADEQLEGICLDVLGVRLEDIHSFSR
jgi:hypothetical protein